MYEEVCVSMERRETVLAAVAFLVALSAGYLTGSTYFGPSLPEGYSASFSFEVNSSHNIRTLHFDNRSVDLLFSDRGRMSAYIDIDQDGGSDRELNITSGEGTTSEILTLRGKSYRIYFSYFDGSGSEDGRLQVVRVSEIV
ncbi:MAG: hypothetical protein ABEJ98_05490 [Candidatus Nanohaloarchaea archaeon]